MNNNSFYRKYLLKSSIPNTLHRTIVIEITRKCHHFSSIENSMGCKHCFQSALNQQTITADVLKKILFFASDCFPVIGIVGGEPFTEFDLLIDIVKHHPNNFINIFTSGEILPDSYITKLQEYNNIVLTISLHGDKEHHNKITGFDSYNKIVQNIAKLNNSKIKWIRKTVASKDNIDYILSSEYEKESMALGCQSIDVCRYYAVGTKTNDDFKINKKQFVLLDAKLKVLTSKGLGIYQEGYGKNCRSLICIDIEGNILPCPYTFYTNWNINMVQSKDEFIDTVKGVKKFWEKSHSKNYYCNLMEYYFN